MQIETVAAKTPAHLIEQVKNYKKKITAAGLCRDCHQPREPERANRSRCSKCAKASAKYARERWKNPEIRDRINAYQRARWAANREYCGQQSKQWRQKVQDEVFAAYGGYICKCCGETERAFLTLDHIYNDGNNHRKKSRERHGANTWLWAYNNDFPPVLRVLCYNCNSGRYRNGGICPHEMRQSHAS